MTIYKEDMYTDFFNQCLEVEKELRQNLPCSNLNRRGYVISPVLIYTKAILRQAKSFYFADEHQLLIAYNKYKITPCNINSPSSIRYKDVCKVFDRLQLKYPDLKPIEIAKKIDLMSEEDQIVIPRFYIGVSHAQSIYYKMYKNHKQCL